MLEFSLREMTFGSRYYILLPKLNSRQMQILKTRLERFGFTVSGGSLVKAKRKGLALHLDMSGLCWSSSDPSDLIVPLIPDLLAVPKEPLPLKELVRRYFILEQSKSGAAVRFEARLEGGGQWQQLRATGQCGLAPDEGAVLLFLLEHSRGECDLLTDYPTSSSRRRIIGGRQYFDSRLSSSEASSTLRSVVTRGVRNSYLPRGGILRLSKFTPPSGRELTALFESLGEWCYLRPRQTRKV